MRRRDLDALTDREREVLELLRRDFTNEQIAQRLGITLDGAKYHVSQILSKLGVGSREEAAAWRPEERRAWWARWPLWAKIAGAATTIGAVVGLAILAWGVWKPTVQAPRGLRKSRPHRRQYHGLTRHQHQRRRRRPFLPQTLPNSLP